jgi:hypothetical protein
MSEDQRRSAIAALAADIKSAFEQRLILDVRAAGIPLWAESIDQLLESGDFGAAHFAASQIAAIRPDLPFMKSVIGLLENLPPPDPSLPPFKDDPRKEVQIVRRPDADAVLLVFCDYAHRVGAPLSAVHNWFGRLPANLIYLRDFRRLFFLDGVPSLGASRDGTLANLRQIIRSAGAGKVFCLGYSAGGFAALHYGLELGADAVLSIAGVVNLTPGFTGAGDFRSEAYRKHPISAHPVDLRALYQRAARPVPSLLVYGDGSASDRKHAEYLAGLPGVRGLAIENCAHHHVVMELIRRGEFAGLLGWLFREQSNARSMPAEAQR